MSITRRSFLRATGLAAAAGLLPLPALAFTSGPPSPELWSPGLEDHVGLWGDGIHDDTDALQAMIDESAATGQGIWLSYGTYLVSRTITLRPQSKFSMTDCVILTKPGLAGPVMSGWL